MHGKQIQKWSLWKPQQIILGKGCVQHDDSQSPHRFTRLAAACLAVWLVGMAGLGSLVCTGWAAGWAAVLLGWLGWLGWLSGLGWLG